jgi:hypothetical protein
MTDDTRALPPPHRKLWVRALLMILMAAAFQLAASVLLFLCMLQLVLAAATGVPNLRLQQLGRSLGRYLLQIAEFESFCTEELPFPFSPWPAVNGQVNP